MRQQQNTNSGRRPRGRTNNNNNSNRKPQGGGQQHRSGNFDSNGPDGRIRGNASQVYEKYIGLARDATSADDRIAAEAYYQHAEHYYRIVNDSTDPESPGSQRVQSSQGQPDQVPAGSGAQPAQAGQVNPALQSNGEIDTDQQSPNGPQYGAQGGQAGRGQPGRQDRSGQDRSGQDRSGQNRSGQERSGQSDRPRFQDRRSRGPARNDAEVPGLEPQPDLATGNVSSKATQSEFSLSRNEGQRRSSQPVEQPVIRPAVSETAVSAPKPVETTAQTPAPQLPAPDVAPQTGQVSAPRRRGRPRKVVETKPDGSGPDVSASAVSAPAKDANDPVVAPVRRRGRPRKVVETSSTSESADSGE